MKDDFGVFRLAILGFIMWCAFAFLFLSCTNDQGPWILKPSKYKNNESLNASLAEEWFHKKYGEGKKDWISFTSFSYEEDQGLITKVCREPAFGCIPWFYDFVIWDLSDDFIRCTTIQHEFGHMGAWLYGSHDGDLDHKENTDYFNKYVFEVCSLMTKKPEKEIVLKPFYIYPWDHQKTPKHSI